MSSFIGHSLAAATVYIATESFDQPLSFVNRLKTLVSKSDRYLWLLWLIVVASIPDLDYLVKAWQSGNNQGLRITHSVLFSAIAPAATIIFLLAIGIREKRLFLCSSQVILVSLSHLILDLSVGVTSLPLLFPLVDISFKLPFGVLPSAGKINLDNYYFYRNLKLEMGVLLPIFSLVCLWSDRATKGSISSSRDFQIKNLIKAFISTLLLLCCIYFVRLNLSLPR